MSKTLRLPVREESPCDISQLLLYRVWPRGSPGEVGIMRVRTGPPQTTFHRATWAEVERRLAREIPNLPEHPDLYRRVIEFGGGRTREVFREVFEAVETNSLPSPHEPFQCVWYERFKSILASSDSTREAGVRFLNSLTSDDVARCPYHLSNWKLVADESVRILRGVRSADTVDHLKMARPVTTPREGPTVARISLQGSNRARG